MARNIFEVLGSLKASLGELEGVLAPLAGFAVDRRPAAKRRRRARRSARVVRAAAPTAAKRKAASSRKSARPASAARKATQVLQGRYLAAIRPLSKANRARVKKVLEQKGKLAAINQAQKLH